MSALHNALAAIDSALPSHPTDSQLVVAAKCRGLLRGYDARWKDSPYEPIEIEQTLHADLPNIDSKGFSRTFQIAGKVDLLANYRGKRLLFDHKTTSQDIADLDSPYWRQLAIEGQVTHYMLLCGLSGIPVDGAVWDVIRKPGIEPKKLTKAERASVVAEGRYFGKVSEDSRRTISEGEERETLEMYEARLAHDCTQERPDRYFQRRHVPRLESEIIEYARELWIHSQDILHTRQTQRYPRNSGACLLYGSPCKFIGICSDHDSPESDRWQRREWPHAELPVVETNKELLTNSRIRCFQTCRRKHHYDYELAIERQDEEEKLALWFGALFHVGLNTWWSCFKEPSNGNCIGSPVNEVGQHASAVGP